MTGVNNLGRPLNGSRTSMPSARAVGSQ